MPRKLARVRRAFGRPAGARRPPCLVRFCRCATWPIQNREQPGSPSSLDDRTAGMCRAVAPPGCAREKRSLKVPSPATSLCALEHPPTAQAKKVHPVSAGASSRSGEGCDPSAARLTRRDLCSAPHRATPHAHEISEMCAGAACRPQLLVDAAVTPVQSWQAVTDDVVRHGSMKWRVS